MKRFTLIATFAASMGLVTGCVKQSTYDASQAQLADAQRQLADTQKQLADANVQLAGLQSQLTTAKALPVHVAFRKPLIGPGFAAYITTTLKRELPVTVTIMSHAFGTSKEFNVIIPPFGGVEFGPRERAPIVDGDTIRISNPDFEPFTVLAQRRE